MMIPNDDDDHGWLMKMMAMSMMVILELAMVILEMAMMILVMTAISEDDYRDDDWNDGDNDDGLRSESSQSAQQTLRDLNIRNDGVEKRNLERLHRFEELLSKGINEHITNTVEKKETIMIMTVRKLLFVVVQKTTKRDKFQIRRR